MKISDLYNFLFGAIVSYSLWYYQNSSNVPFLYLFIAIILIVALLYLYFIKKQEMKDLISTYESKIQALESTKLENAVFSAKIIEATDELILFKPNIHNIISYDQLITIYVLDSNFEKFYAIAKITNIQTDKRFIQAQIVLVDSIAFDKYGNISKINNNLLKISPNVSIEKIRPFD